MMHKCVSNVTIIVQINFSESLITIMVQINFSEGLTGILTFVIQENALEYVVCEIAAILSRP